jgi:hypothetical protein
VGGGNAGPFKISCSVADAPCMGDEVCDWKEEFREFATYEKCTGALELRNGSRIGSSTYVYPIPLLVVKG